MISISHEVTDSVETKLKVCVKSQRLPVKESPNGMKSVARTCLGDCDLDFPLAGFAVGDISFHCITYTTPISQFCDHNG